MKTKAKTAPPNCRFCGAVPIPCGPKHDDWVESRWECMSSIDDGELRQSQDCWARQMRQKLKDEERQNGKYRRSIDRITTDLVKVIHALDMEMKKPSDNGRGKRVARILNQLELGNDSIMRYTLGLSFKQIENRKNKVAKAK